MRSDETGWVRWPGHLDTTGEGGVFVLAVFLVREDASGRDAFCACYEAGSVLFEAGENLVVNPHASDKRAVFPRTDDHHVSAPVLAVVGLGSTCHAYVTSHAGGYWHCTRDDLTPEGLALLASLERLYDRPALLLTLLDT